MPEAEPTRAGRPGPERPTLFERFITLIPLRYPAAALVWLALTSPFAYLLTVWVDLGDLGPRIAAIEAQGVPFWQWLALIALFQVGIVYYVFLVIRRLRLRVVAAISEFAPLVPGGEEECRRAFARVSDARPALFVTLLIALAFAPTLTTSMSTFGAGAQLAFFYWQSALWFWSYGTIAWVYFASAWGLRQIGRQTLRLRPYSEDRMLGLRPLGELSLSLAGVFSLALILFTVLQIVGPSPLSTTTFLLVVLAVLGSVMFFLPLAGAHAQMAAYREGLRAPMQAEVLRAAERPEGLASHAERTLALDAAERRLAAMPTWPFDTQIANRLIAILTSIVVAIVIKVILDRLSI